MVDKQREEFRGGLMDASADSTLLPAVIGMLVDVSGSMTTSIRNEGEELSRFESCLESIRTAARQRMARHDARDAGTSAPMDRIFAYAFGLRSPGHSVCDLFTLLALAERFSGHGDQSSTGLSDRSRGFSVGSGTDPYAELERIARPHGRDGWMSWARQNLNREQARTLLANVEASPALTERVLAQLPPMSEAEMAQAEALSRRRGGIRRKFTVASDPMTTAGLAFKKGKLTDEALAEAEALIRRLAERHDLSELIAEELDRMGWTTLNPPELARLLERQISRNVDQTAPGLLYGGTPLCAALSSASARFWKERKILSGFVRDINEKPLNTLLHHIFEAKTLFEFLRTYFADALTEGTRPNQVLLVVSDGQATDGDPTENFSRLKADGVLVVCCYLADRDVVRDPRHLLAVPDPSWDAGATAMFTGTSEIMPFYRDHLRERGWTVEPQARLFFQANHSRILSEVADLVLL
jgi:hypothetical protein